MGLEIAVFVTHIRCVKTITKRELLRNASALGHLKPGESVEVRGRDGNLIVSRPRGQRLSAQQMEAELDRLADKCPPLDVQAVLNDLRS